MSLSPATCNQLSNNLGNHSRHSLPWLWCWYLTIQQTNSMRPIVVNMARVINAPITKVSPTISGCTYTFMRIDFKCSSKYLKSVSVLFITSFSNITSVPFSPCNPFGPCNSVVSYNQFTKQPMWSMQTMRQWKFNIKTSLLITKHFQCYKFVSSHRIVRHCKCEIEKLPLTLFLES